MKASELRGKKALYSSRKIRSKRRLSWERLGEKGVCRKQGR